MVFLNRTPFSEDEGRQGPKASSRRGSFCTCKRQQKATICNKWQQGATRGNKRQQEQTRGNKSKQKATRGSFCTYNKQILAASNHTSHPTTLPSHHLTISLSHHHVTMLPSHHLCVVPKRNSSIFVAIHLFHGDVHLEYCTIIAGSWTQWWWWRRWWDRVCYGDDKQRWQWRLICWQWWWWCCIGGDYDQVFDAVIPLLHPVLFHLNEETSLHQGQHLLSVHGDGDHDGLGWRS